MERYIEWKWSIGEKPIRSLRTNVNTDTNEYDQTGVYNQEQTEMHVINQCLYSGDEMFIDQSQKQMLREFQTQPNKREDTYTRMAEREMMGQIGMNPFFSNNGSNSGYIEDLMNQENFLKPISTSMEKTKD